MDTDDRFKHLASDPRFKTLRKKQRKVQVDERFQSMFTDERFTLKSSKDKRGRKHKKKSGDDLTKYYTLEKEKEEVEKDDEVVNEESDSDDQEEIEDWTEKVDDEDEEEEEGAENEDEELEDDDSEDSDQSEVSSSSDESESEDEGVNDVNAIQYDWQPLDHDAEKAETVTRRLAIQNLDWTHLDVRDIYTLVNSIRPPLNVRVYISQFGKERLAREEVEGPEELADMPQVDEEEEEYNLLKSRMEALESKDSKAKSSTFKVNEYEDADEVLDMKNEEIRERIRRYQLSRMKYYYAIAEFDSVESAEAVYKELDGIEYEGSSLELDLRFVPDEMEFDQADMKSECSKVPDLATYKAPQFINSALQQTTVKFTWDETDVKRQEKLQRAYTKEELEKDDLDAYLASDDSDDDDDVDEGDKESPVDDADGTTTTTTATSETDKYRKLLKSLDEEAERKKRVDVDVVWGDYEGDERRTAAAAGKQEKSSSAKQSEDKATSKRKSESKKKQRQKNNAADEDDDDDDQDDAHLDLLVMEARKQEEFQFNPDDDRFGAVYESGLYNIDPSHPNFKRTQAFDQMAEKKREKRWKSSR